jgi:Ankyrin repeats (3 copies)
VELLLAQSHELVDKALVDYARQRDGPRAQKCIKESKRYFEEPHSGAYYSHDGWTALMFAIEEGHHSIVTLLLADNRVDKTSIDHMTANGHSALIAAASSSQGFRTETSESGTSMLDVFLTDSRVDKTSLEQVGVHRQTVLMALCESDFSYCSRNPSALKRVLDDDRVDTSFLEYANKNGDTAMDWAACSGSQSAILVFAHHPKTSFRSIAHAITHKNSNLTQDTEDKVATELTRRQMLAIFPSNDRRLWPVPQHQDLDQKTNANNQLSQTGPESVGSGLISSFFSSPLLDVNVLRIIREFAKITLVWRQSDSGDAELHLV